MNKPSYIYILTNRPNGVLYVGVTNDLSRRVYEHKQGYVPGFTKKYNLNQLVYFEVFESIEEAILREKHMKKWNGEWKVKRIVSLNPEWKDLYFEITESAR